MKFFSKILKSDQQSQSGVTLMLAILVLAAVTAVAFSLATIVLIEVRVSGDVLKTEPAMYATMGVTEEALFQYKRFITPDDSTMNVPHCLPTGLELCSLNGVNLELPGTQPIEFDDSPKIQVIPAQTKISLPMYKPDNFEKQYSLVRVEILSIGSGASVYVNLIETNDHGDHQEVPSEPVLISQGRPPFEYTGFAAPAQYDLVLDNRENVDATVSITTVREPVASPAGLPFTGEQVLRIMANYAGLTRTYQVRIPIP
jgi:hypothetical protein